MLFFIIQIKKLFIFLAPLITSSNANILADSKIITIKGNNFSSTISENLVSLYQSPSVSPTCTPSKINPDSLECNNFSFFQNGAIFANVTTNYGRTSGKAIQIGTISKKLII